MRQRKLVVTAGAVLCLTAALARPVRAQDNYEIQVYGSDLVPVGATMVEFHSNFTPRVTGALEYYGALGSIHGFDAAREQVHLLVPSIDLNLSPLREINLGVGLGLTRNTDGPLIKAIVGRRFGR